MTASVAQQPSYPGGVPWWLILVEGIAVLILGVLLLVAPGMTTLILVQFVGIYWLIAGIFKIISIFMDSSGWGWKMAGGIVVGLLQAFKGGGWGAAVLGVISILFGLLFLFNVLGFTVALPGALGVLGLIGGIIAIVGAFKLRSAT